MKLSRRELALLRWLWQAGTRGAGPAYVPHIAEGAEVSVFRAYAALAHLWALDLVQGTWIEQRWYPEGPQQRRLTYQITAAGRDAVEALREPTLALARVHAPSWWTRLRAWFRGTSSETRPS